MNIKEEKGQHKEESDYATTNLYQTESYTGQCHVETKHIKTTMNTT